MKRYLLLVLIFSSLVGAGVSFGLRGAADSGRSPDGDRGGREPNGSAPYDSEAGSLTSENE